jgi:hypothetical protein
MEKPLEKLINAIHDLDNHLFFASDCTLTFWFGTNDNGERYVDAEVVKGHARPEGSRETLADIIGADDLMSAIQEINEEL